MSEMKLIMESWRGYQNFDLEDVLEEIDVLVEEYKEVLEKEHILSERKVTLIKESIVQKIAQLAKSAFSRVASMASSGAEKVASFLDSLVGKVGRLKSHAPGLVKFITAGAFAALVTLMPSMAQAAAAVGDQILTNADVSMITSVIEHIMDLVPELQRLGKTAINVIRDLHAAEGVTDLTQYFTPESGMGKVVQGAIKFWKATAGEGTAYNIDIGDLVTSFQSALEHVGSKWVS